MEDKLDQIIELLEKILVAVTPVKLDIKYPPPFTYQNPVDNKPPLDFNNDIQCDSFNSERRD